MITDNGMEKILKKCGELPSWAVYAAIAAASLIFMIWHAEDSGFWYDEFAQICFSGLDSTLLDSLTTVDPTPPLFNVMANIWYHIVPYGERWLLLLPQTAMAFAVYISGLWGERLNGRMTGICTALLLGSSQMVIEQCGFEFRGYGTYLLFAVSVLYMHDLRVCVGEKHSAGSAALYTVLLICLIYSHLFGLLVFAALGMFDLLAVRTAKNRLLNAIPYVCAGAAFLPWLIYFWQAAGTASVGAAVDWMVKPNPWEVIKLIAYLCGNHIIVCALFMTGTIWVLYGFAAAGQDRFLVLRKLVPIVVGIVMISVMYCFGIVRAGQASLWVKRYFTALFPCCAVITAMGAVAAANFISRRLPKVKEIHVYAAVFVLVVPVFLYRTAVVDTPLAVYHHREAAEFLYEQDDIMDCDVIVLSTLGDTTPGWYSYYVERQGSRKGFLAASVYDIDPKDMDQYNVVYVDTGYLYENCAAKEMIADQFELDSYWQDVSVERYVRKTLAGH